MLMDESALKELLRCPKTGQKLNYSSEEIKTADGTGSYQRLNGKPVLVDFDVSTIDKETLFKSQGKSIIKRSAYTGIVKKFFKGIVSPFNIKIKKNFEKFVQNLSTVKSPRVLIIGGGTVGTGSKCLYNSNTIEVIAFDVYDSPEIQFIADAHQIPLESNSVDGVVIQFVLEHVLEPQKVVDEIYRVLKDDAIVYAETPFLQQVHEGAFDFTRFTESGHRYLFRKFKLLDSGVIAGAGTHLLWSIEYFFRGLFRSWKIGKIFKLGLFWLQYFDRIIPDNYNIDAADSVFFMGRKSDNSFPANQMYKYYKGADKK